MRLRITRTGKNAYVQVVEDIRRPDGRRTTQVVKSFGSVTLENRQKADKFLNDVQNYPSLKVAKLAEESEKLLSRFIDRITTMVSPQLPPPERALFEGIVKKQKKGLKDVPPIKRAHALIAIYEMLKPYSEEKVK